MLTDPVWFIHQILELEVAIYLRLHDLQLQMLEVFHFAFQLFMENWYKTIPLTTPSSSYLKRQYLKPQIKQAHLLIIIKPLPPYQNMSDINKLSPSPFSLPLPLWRLNWGIPQSAGSMQEIYTAIST